MLRLTEWLSCLRYVVAGDFVHHLFVGEYAKAYPDAKVIGVEGLGEKRKDVKFVGGGYMH